MSLKVKIAIIAGISFVISAGLFFWYGIMPYIGPA